MKKADKLAKNVIEFENFKEDLEKKLIEAKKDIEKAVKKRDNYRKRVNSQYGIVSNISNRRIYPCPSCGCGFGLKSEKNSHISWCKKPKGCEICGEKMGSNVLQKFHNLRCKDEIVKLENEVMENFFKT
jgi:hypothetical protein